MPRHPFCVSMSVPTDRWLPLGVVTTTQSPTSRFVSCWPFTTARRRIMSDPAAHSRAQTVSGGTPLVSPWWPSVPTTLRMRSPSAKLANGSTRSQTSNDRNGTPSGQQGITRRAQTKASIYPEPDCQAWPRAGQRILPGNTTQTSRVAASPTHCECVQKSHVIRLCRLPVAGIEGNPKPMPSTLFSQRERQTLPDRRRSVGLASVGSEDHPLCRTGRHFLILPGQMTWSS